MEPANEATRETGEESARATGAKEDKAESRHSSSGFHRNKEKKYTQRCTPELKKNLCFLRRTIYSCYAR